MGIALYIAAASVPVLIFTHDRLKGEGGLLAGGAVAVLMMLSMKASIEYAVHMTKGHSAYLGIVSTLRLLVVAVFLFASAWSGWVNVITAVIGVMSLKAATYLQPFTEKLMVKATKKQGR